MTIDDCICMLNAHDHMIVGGANKKWEGLIVGGAHKKWEGLGAGLSQATPCTIVKYRYVALKKK